MTPQPAQLRELIEQLRGANIVGFGSLRTWANFNETRATEALARLDAIEKHLEELTPLHSEGGGYCTWCETRWPCGHHAALEAALKLIRGDS